MPSLWAVAGIVLLLGPALLALDLQRDETGWCDHSKALHRRLNIIEKNIEQTVNHMEAEVSDLLALISTTNVSLPSGPPHIDIFDSGG
ncbi:placenta-specific protein 9-like isoform X2 [Narcine bancroftii]|uniref:placenta-specific protein 9-like isoform X2 n=1 Tax=Narcine bancroftii TaxID=1343680 RepID=UPI00383179EB